MWSGKVEQDEENGSVELGAAANPDMNCGEVLKKPGPGPGRRNSMCKALRQDRAGALGTRSQWWEERSEEEPGPDDMRL